MTHTISTTPSVHDSQAFERARRHQLAAMQQDAELRGDSTQWIAKASRYQYSHHFDWMGLPIIQFPQDIIALQEIIFRNRPELIIETGIARGGSLVFYASMLEMLGGCGVVCGIDVDLRAENRNAIMTHPLARRIQLVDGSSVERSVVSRVRVLARECTNVMVVLDSDHSHDHVLQELRLYAPLVTAGQYLIVFDTVINSLPKGYFRDRPWDVGNSPKSALDVFLRETTCFEVDRDIDSKLLISAAPGGYLRRIAD